MELINGIFTRRSIRKYTKQLVSDDDIRTILAAGMQSPSAANCQPWHFVQIQDKDHLEEITRIHPYASMLKEASLAICILGDTKIEHGPGYWTADCGAATQNILLAAHGLGLGAVWLGIHPRVERIKTFAEYFNLPDHIKPFALVSIGYPDEDKPMVDRYQQNRVHYETW